ncbi:hypothetical protein COP00_14370 [Bacillus glycinifermentans]|uniref:Uncharacterized protein n=1 Tax=Bacillus glycinifermentans TaxID=1664069 RepID=A0A0T6BJU4_9BACI|nr:hypothetical protein COP00_14370 [Bacillus glycinifermentans]KRT90161.1 hypothetical protein AB447_206155 [Bacillus glycinifermentans]
MLSFFYMIFNSSFSALSAKMAQIKHPLHRPSFLTRYRAFPLTGTSSAACFFTGYNTLLKSVFPMKKI